MRSAIAVVSAASLIVAQVPAVGFAQTAAPLQPVTLGPAQTAQNPVIAEAFKAFPNGGDAFSKRIADLIVGDPKLATDVLRFVKTGPGVTYGQKIAAERGLAAALDRMGVKAADMPVKAPRAPVEEPYDYTWLAALAAAALIAGIVCAAECPSHEHGPISPN